MPPTKDLPDPDEIAALLASMRDTVTRAYAEQQEEIDEARAIIEAAEAKKAELRQRYPMFFEQAAPKSPSAAKPAFSPSPQAQNQLLRILAEHPGVTRRRAARLVNFSESWVGYAVKALNSRPEGAVIAFGKSGRLQTLTLTEAGMKLADNGGVPAEED